MAPPRQACQLLADIMSAAADVMEAWEKIKKSLADIRKTRANIKYGIIDIADFTASELLNAVASIATTIAQSMAGPVTAASAALIEAILSEILMILLAFPTAIFSLVAIPHRQAIDATSAERMKLVAARQNIMTILRIISKWTQGYGGTAFYEQIVGALPHIEKAIKYSNQMIQDLANVMEYQGGGRDAQFNEGIYKSMKAEIQQAMVILKPKSVIVERSNILPMMQKEQKKKRDQLVAVINTKYNADKKAIDLKHAQELSKSLKNGASLESAIAKEKADNVWAFELKLLDTKRKEDIAAAEIKAAADAEFNSGILEKAAKGIVGEFAYDMKLVGDNLYAFLQNMRHAYENYQLSQMACNTCYSIRGLIIGIINDIVAMLRGAGNVAADAVITVLRTSQAALQVADDHLSDAKSRYEGVPQSISSTELAFEVATGYGLVSAADAMTSATITQSLANLINADSVVQAANADFDKFVARLSSIQDWDGSKDIWVPKPAEGATPPYIQVIADTTSLLSMIPAIGFSNSKENRDKIAEKVNRVNSHFKTLSRHNAEVQSVLSSYSPYVGAQAGNLIRILSSAGLLKDFAIGMNIAVLLEDIVKTALTYDTRDFPSYPNCLNAPFGKEMFPDDKKISGAVAMKKTNLPAYETSPKFTTKLEDDTYGIMQTRVNTKKTRLLDGHSDQDLWKDEDVNKT